MPSKPLKAIKPMFPQLTSWKLRPGDLVEVVTGKDKCKQGKVLKVIRDQRFPRVFVEGINMVTRHVRRVTKPDGEVIPGYTVKLEGAIHYSNVMIVDPETKRPVRVRFGYEDKPPHNKIRLTRGRLASGCLVPWPDDFKERPKRNTDVGDKDTRPEDAEAVTYNPEADFTLEVPSAHRRLREQRAARELTAAQKLQQHRLKPMPKLFSNARGYHTTAAAAAVGDLQLQLSKCSLADGSSSSISISSQIPFESSGRSLSWLIGCRGSGSSSRRDSAAWCGLAAAPYLL